MKDKHISNVRCTISSLIADLKKNKQNAANTENEKSESSEEKVPEYLQSSDDSE